MAESAKGPAIVLVTCALALGLGSVLLRIVRLRLDSAPELLVYAVALGLGAMAYVVLGFGLVGHLRMGIGAAYGLAVVLTLIAVLVRRGPAASGGEWTSEFGPLAKVCLAIIGLAVIVTWIGSAAPPVSDDWDSLAYHLADPKVYLQHDRIVPLWYESHSNFPFTMEMLYTIGLGLGSVAAAKGFHWACYILAVLATMALSRRFFRHDDEKQRFPPSALFAGLIFASVPIVLWEATSAYIDIGTALFLCLAVHAVFLWRDRRRTSCAVVTGIFAGLAMGTKYTTVFYAFVLGAIFVFDGIKEWAGGRKTLGDALVYGLIALAVASPWYVKSCVWTRNPVYPFYYEVFDGKNWNQHNADAYRGSQMHFGMGRGPLAFLMSPINLTLRPSAFNDPVSTDPWVIYLYSVGPIFLAAGVCILAARGAPRELWYILVLLALAWIAWFVQMQYARYLISLAPLASVAAGWLIWNAGRRLAVLRRVIVAVPVALALVNVVLLGWLVAWARLPVVFGSESREEYLYRNLGALYDVSRFINEQLPAGTKIIMYQEVRGFYIDRAYMWGNPEHHDLIPYGTFRTHQDLIAGLRAQGITHVLMYYPAMPSPEVATGWVALLYDAFFEDGLALIYQEPRGSPQYMLFEIGKR
jgi:hypothetical protein